jgi:hypothetical protein
MLAHAWPNFFGADAYTLAKREVDARSDVQSLIANGTYDRTINLRADDILRRDQPDCRQRFRRFFDDYYTVIQNAHGSAMDIVMERRRGNMAAAQARFETFDSNLRIGRGPTERARSGAGSFGLPYPTAEQYIAEAELYYVNHQDALWSFVDAQALIDQQQARIAQYPDLAAAEEARQREWAIALGREVPDQYNPVIALRNIAIARGQGTAIPTRTAMRINQRIQLALQGTGYRNQQLQVALSNVSRVLNVAGTGENMKRFEVALAMTDTTLLDQLITTNSESVRETIRTRLTQDLANALSGGLQILEDAGVKTHDEQIKEWAKNALDWHNPNLELPGAMQVKTDTRIGKLFAGMLQMMTTGSEAHKQNVAEVVGYLTDIPHARIAAATNNQDPIVWTRRMQELFTLAGYGNIFSVSNSLPPPSVQAVTDKYVYTNDDAFIRLRLNLVNNDKEIKSIKVFEQNGTEVLGGTRSEMYVKIPIENIGRSVDGLRLAVQVETMDGVVSSGLSNSVKVEWVADINDLGKLFDVRTNYESFNPQFETEARNFASAAFTWEPGYEDYLFNKPEELSYWNRSLRQVVLGNYAGDVTLLGTGGQIAFGFTGIDIVGDVRDVIYNIQNWEVTKGDPASFAFDLVGVVPIVGVLKNAKHLQIIARNTQGAQLELITKIEKRIDATHHLIDWQGVSGHVLQEHVGKTREYLVSRNIRFASTFEDAETAEDILMRTLVFDKNKYDLFLNF